MFLFTVVHSVFVSATPPPVTVTERVYTAPSSTMRTTTTQTPEQSTQTISRPNFQTQRPSFMTKPIDSAPLYSYRPPDINVPSLGNLDTSSEQNSDIVNKISYNSVHKYQNVNRPSDVETSPHNKISSSLSLMSGARPMAVSDQHSDNSISSGKFISIQNIIHNSNSMLWL